MRTYRFRIVNVFTVDDAPFSGNPLCVFEDGRGLSDAEMQALGRQFNLSETTFVLPPQKGTAEGATARVRIFTPSFEMPFAGHPTLGTAHVVRALYGCGDRLGLEMPVGLVEVTARANEWTLRAARAPETRVPDATSAELAAMLGLPESAILEKPLWVDTGAEQLVIPLADTAAVRSARPDGERLARLGFNQKRGAAMAYVFARGPNDETLARFFFLVNGGVVEDPATGSACANLGGYLLSTGRPLPIRWTVFQGDAINRPSRLRLHVDPQRHIFVSGEVIELGTGSLVL